SGDDVDVLVALDEYAYNAHREDLSDNGVAIYNSGEFQLPGGGQYFGIDADELAKSTGNTRAANMVTIGAVADLIGFSLEEIDAFITARFTRGRPGDDEIIESNKVAIRLGVNVAENSGFSVGTLASPIPPDYDQIMITGNAALALGAVTAGLDFYVGYPISPATTILVWMEQNLVGKGRFAHQVSSEIEAISAIVGAGYAGKKSMTAPAGPGLSLMGEGIGLAWMAEIPCVVVDVQRGGPSTGLPTKSEQSDLMTCLHPGHGDVSIPILAPGSVEECFSAGVLAVNWAERYQGPVIVMSEFGQAEKGENIQKPDLSSVNVERRSVYTGSNGYARYESWSENGLSPMPIPGGPGAYVANGSEHDEIGDTTHLPRHHVRLTERRFKKLDLLNDAHYEIEDEGATAMIMSWGSSKGPAREAYERLKADGVDVGWLYSMALNPLPEAIKDALSRANLVIVPELNFMGQWSAVLRQHGYRAESVTQYTGLPFKPATLVDRIAARVAELRAEKGKVLA
ncbi:MAG: 2-oxoacid:acceptor oxidoreductase subunit alpha, partial [Chloroflexi bacterium]|nr:2-oxoacid:acceptor oxidoreductase subunit alpha [Chloroflexota bacterium]